MVSKVRSNDDFDSAIPTAWVEIGSVGAATAGPGSNMGQPESKVLCRRADKKTYQIRGTVDPVDGQVNPVMFVLPAGLVADVPIVNFPVSDVSYKNTASSPDDRDTLIVNNNSADLIYAGTTEGSGQYFFFDALIPVKKV